MLTDCHYLLDQLINVGLRAILPYKFIDPVRYILAYEFLTEVKKTLDSTNTTLCDYCMTIDGVLTDQSSYYMSTYDDIKESIVGKAVAIQNAITFESNSTINEPMMNQFKKVSLVEDFLNSILTQVIIFLAILSS